MPLEEHFRAALQIGRALWHMNYVSYTLRQLLRLTILKPPCPASPING